MIANVISERGMSMKKSVFPKIHVAEEQDALTEQLFPASDANKLPSSTLNTPQLADHCLKELDHYHRGEPYTEVYGVELLRRATILDDPQAWEMMQYCFGNLVLAWLRRHPSREIACRLENEDYYVAQTFERFWQATALTHKVTFSTIAAALRYLQLSLNGAILDSIRASKRSKEV